MTKITEQQNARVIDFGKTIWENLSRTERERYYCGDGTIAFVVNLLTILHLDQVYIPSEDFDKLLTAITDDVKATPYNEYLIHINVKLNEELVDSDYDRVENAINEVLQGKISPRGAEITLVDEL